MNYVDIEKYYDNRVGGWRPRHCYKYFLDLLRPFSIGQTLYDVGCGHGDFLALAANAGLSTSGCDISTNSVNISRTRSPHSCIVKINFANAPVVCKYDIVTCIGVLEHTLNMTKACQYLYDSGRRGTKYLIVVPNKKFPFTTQVDKQLEETSFDYDVWKSLFTSMGFNFVKVAKDLSLPDKYMGVKRLLFRTILNLLPMKRTYQFCFLLERP